MKSGRVYKKETELKIPGKQNQSVNNLPLQAKLTVGSPGDSYEKEADAVASKIMRMPEQNFVQRKCAECEEEDKKKIQRKPVSETITPFIQTKSNGEAAVGDSLTSSIHSSRGNGSSLDSSTQSFMESRFGADFNPVKIHTGREAVQMNRELNAQAFTVGNDIYFNEGKFQPQSSEGKQLLAHELTHVVQQENLQMIQEKPIPGGQCKVPFHTCRVNEGVSVGKQYVDAAIGAIIPVADGKVAAGPIVDLLNKHFKEGAVADAGKILENYQSVKNELDADINYQCYDENPPDCKTEKGVVGAFTECVKSSDVHLCIYFNIAGCEERGRIIVHELTHHLGFCRDYAYADEEKYKTLAHVDAMRNADCYAQFAKDVFVGKAGCKC